MFDILVYLYETYYRPETCPDSIVLAKKLSSVGFDDEEIMEALNWLSGLADSTRQLAANAEQEAAAHFSAQTQGFRVFTEEENQHLGCQALGFIHYLYNAGLIDAQQREVIIDRAMAIDEAPISLAKLKVVVLMMLWSLGSEPGMLMLDELLLSQEDSPRLMH